MFAPVKAQPVDVFLDGVHVFGGFLARIGVVKAEMTDPVVLLGNAEVQADGLGMADMEEAVGFRRESGDDVAVFAGFQVVGNDLADEVKGFGWGVRGICHILKFRKELLSDEYKPLWSTTCVNIAASSSVQAELLVMSAALFIFHCTQVHNFLSK